MLLAHFLGIVRVENFYLDLTFLIVAMLIIGGRGSLTGAVAGAVVDRGSDRAAAADRNRRSDRQDDDRRATRHRRRHPRTDHALDHSVPAKRLAGRRELLAVRTELEGDLINQDLMPSSLASGNPGLGRMLGPRFARR